MRRLQDALATIPFGQLPATWTAFDFATFSRTKQLWDYQQAALKHALVALWQYHSEPDLLKRKERFFQWYSHNDISLAPQLPLGKKRDNSRLLAHYYPIIPHPKEPNIAYHHLINRMGFWMATGSGKTLVIVKLLELLWTLMQRGCIPARQVMVLTHREDLLAQLRQHINEFNAGNPPVHLRLHELRQFPQSRYENRSLFSHQELTVFFYRSDNLSDEQKERIVDFRNYDNHGQWYLLLDEAHKGDKEDSKRQHIYNILSREGFLFNFSATFTDERDILTTAYEFNLARFIAEGYGKHLLLFQQENQAFRNREDFSHAEKQQVVLQALCMLTYCHKAIEALRQQPGKPLYHRPLLLALVHSVNTEEADLKLFFRELERVGKGEVSEKAFQTAKMALKSELTQASGWLYETESFQLDEGLLAGITLKDVCRHIFNADSFADMELLVRPSNDKELAFRLKSSTAGQPFALIKIGQTAEWLKNFLVGYDLVKGFEDEAFFTQLNSPSSHINLLMGSRSFYEGWDSNRPNVIMFINIGTGPDAKKFILQSVGRGVRIEPVAGKRKRLMHLYNGREVTEERFVPARPYISAVETLFLFGTKREALATILDNLKKENPSDQGQLLSLSRNQAALSHHPVLIPVYGAAERLIYQHAPRKFELQASEQVQLQNYITYLNDDRLLMAHHRLSPQQIGQLRTVLSAPETYFNPHTQRIFGQIDVLLTHLTHYFGVVGQQLAGFKSLEDEISHFKQIRVWLKELKLKELQEIINQISQYTPSAAQAEKFKELLAAGHITPEQYNLFAKMADSYVTSGDKATFSHDGQQLQIKHVANHYYLPMLLSENEKIAYITHIISVPSELRFVQQLEAYLKQPDNYFQQFDWWLFSRTDETVDKVHLPYYDPHQNQIREFHPDFVFWLVKGDRYTILFVDPKGMRFSDYQHKIDGYRELFADTDGNFYRYFQYGNYQVSVALALYTTDVHQAPMGYRAFWFDRLQTVLAPLLKG